MSAKIRMTNSAEKTIPPTLMLHLPDEAATQALGRALGPLLKPGMVVWLDGDLGAGKTALARAVLRGLGYEGPVKSPTYTLVEFYVVSRLYLYHFDFYRFNEPHEFEDAGLGEYFRDDAVCLVEWPDKAAGYVPAADLRIVFRFADAARRDGTAGGLSHGPESRVESGIGYGMAGDPTDSECQAESGGGRWLALHAHGAAGEQCLNSLSAHYARHSNAAN